MKEMLRYIGRAVVAAHRHALQQGYTTQAAGNSFKFNFGTCWKCGQKRKDTAELFCDKCKFIQRPEETDNYFKIFRLPQKFNVDLPSLQKQYRAMQAQLHPDKFSKSSNEEKNISADYSSLVNNAYNTLSNPMSRALHLLKLHNEKILESDKSTNAEFLAHIMDLNESVENAKTEADLRHLNDKNRLVLKQIGQDLVRKFDDHDIYAAKQLVVKMKYYHTISTKIKEAMGNRGIVD